MPFYPLVSSCPEVVGTPKPKPLFLHVLGLLGIYRDGNLVVVWSNGGRRSNSPIHKAAGSLVTGRSLKNGKMSMGNRHTERPPDPVLYGGRPSGGFVNSAVSVMACGV